jgi:hypothetical protein
MSTFTKFRYLLSLILLALYSHCIASNWVEDISYSKEASLSSSKLSDGYVCLLYDSQVSIEKEEVYNKSAIKVLTNYGLAAASSISINYDQSYQIFH